MGSGSYRYQATDRECLPNQQVRRGGEEHMALAAILDKPALQNLRTAVATIRAIGFVAVTIATLGTGAYLTLWRSAENRGIALTATSGLAACGVMLIGFWYYLEHVHQHQSYEILELEALLIVEPVDDHHRYVYTRRQTVRALRDNLRLVELRAHWTGRGSKNTYQVESLNHEHLLFDARRPEEDGRVYRWIYLRSPLGKGSEAEVGVRQIHEDDIEIQFPFFRDSGGAYNARRILVTVRFPLDEDPQSVAPLEGRVWNVNRPVSQNHVVGRLTFTRNVDRDAGTVEYSVTACRPERYHSYGLSWSWSKRYSGD